MLKTKSNRIKHCTHCNEEFTQTKSNQKFCSTSCRVASWKMNKEKKAVIKAKLDDLPVMQHTEQKTRTTNVVDSTLGTLVGGLVIEGMKTFRGINNNDIIKKLDVVLQNQITIANSQQGIANLINSKLPKTHY
jgi:hypothetical protein